MKRVLLSAVTLFLLSTSWSCFAFAEDWKPFTSKTDLFRANFPGDPVITETPWVSEYGANLTARLYTVKQDTATYSVTFVDYNPVRSILTAKAKECPDELERCNGLTAYSGEGYWKNDVRGAMLYTEFKFLQRDVKVTSLMWNYLGAQGVEVNEMQFTNNADKSRTFVAIYMYHNRLYITEGTVPGDYPPPTLFQQSLSLLEEDGSEVHHLGVYFNGAEVDKNETYTRMPGRQPRQQGLPQESPKTGQ